jgi:CubicO group peptidase (beta-lactamase class C family)
MTQSTPHTGLQRLHAAMAARVERGDMPGMVTLVAREDEVHVDAIGVKAFGSSEPMRRETLFRIASMTKPIVAAATMMLVEDGKLGLDDSVERWLPELANRRVLRNVDGPLDDTEPANRPITIDDLLTFRMGFGHLFFGGAIDPPVPVVKAANDLQLVLGPPDPRTPHPPDKWLELFGTLPLMYQPGERWQYNVGSLVLGVLIARVARMPLGDFIGARILEPLGMDDTGFWLPRERTRSLPSFYMSAADPRDVSTPEEWSRPPVFPSGAGGLVSTADDFLAFARLLLNGGTFGGNRLLSQESVDLMTTNHLTPEQMSTGDPIQGGRGWGFGVGIATEPDADWPFPGRYGWAGGYGTTWFNDPHRGIIAIAMTQVSDFLWQGGLVEFEKLVAAI